jgi:hypothetical protein
MIRRAATPFLVVAAFAVAAPGVMGQLNFGVHAARAADAFGGANGAGVSLELDVPLFPVDFMIAGDYFRPDCGAASGCSYMGASADIHLALPFPVFQPYALAGAVVRRTKADSGVDAVNHRGLAVGAGVNVRALVVGAYGEARYEFVDPKHQFVFRLGLRL